MFVAGQYTATIGASPVSIGQVKEGFRRTHEFFKRLITGDNFAEAKQDAVYRGGDVHVQFTLLEYDAAGTATLIWPYGTFGDLGVIGVLDTSVATPLILTAIAGTTAATRPATMTFPTCVLAEGYPVELLFAPDLREVPLRLRCYPNPTAGASFKKHHVQT